MDHSAAPLLDALVDYHARDRYGFTRRDTARGGVRIRVLAPCSARTRSGPTS